MALGDGIRRNIAHVEPSERDLSRCASRAEQALLPWLAHGQPARRSDLLVQAGRDPSSHACPWFSRVRAVAPRDREPLRRTSAGGEPQLSLHYWDWTEDPRSIPNANLGGGTTGTLNLFTQDFMGHGAQTPS